MWYYRKDETGKLALEQPSILLSIATTAFILIFLGSTSIDLFLRQIMILRSKRVSR